MAEEVVSTYLRNKFSSTLGEAEEDPSTPLKIISRFRSIERQINRSADRASPIPVDLLYHLIDALSEFRILTHQRHEAAASKKGFFWFDPLSKFLFKKKMRRRLDEIEMKLKKTSSPPEDETESSSPILDPSLIGFESQAEKMEGLLLNMAKYNLAEDAASTSTKSEKEEADQQGVTAIGIVGRCGCGKTALAQKVFANPRIQAEFSPRIWVCLSNMLFESERVDPRVRVLNHILEEMGCRDVSEQEYYVDDFSVDNKLLEKVKRGLMGKKYLIVLDDAWREDERYADLGYFFSHGLPKESGGAIIVTSRWENVMRRTVGNKHVIRLEPHLSDAICWNIFSNVLLQQGNMNRDHPKLNEMKDEVIRNCDGLPLAAKTLANIIPNLLKFWIPARKLEITWGEDTRYWKWTSLPPPDELEEVAELLNVCWLYISGQVNVKKLLLETTYSAYLVFKLNEGSYRLEQAVGRIRFLSGENQEVIQKHSVFIDREKTPGDGGHFPEPRGKGWMEVKLGEFFNNRGDDGIVEATLDQTTDQLWKYGLVVRGIEVRPNF